jgi:outer membrane protein OmpU
MKKILVATTALIATTGMAAAEISFGGFGRFGVLYEENGAEETQIESRFRLTVTGTTETDSGIKFGGRIRVEANDGDQDSLGGGNGFGGAGFWAETGGFRMDVGNTSDVLDSGDAFSYGGTGVSFIGNIDQGGNVGTKKKDGFGAGGADQTTVKVRYNVGDLTLAASYSDDDTAGDGASTQVGVGYTFGDYRVGAVYGNGGVAGSDDFKQWAIGFGATFGDLALNGIVFDNNIDGEDTVIGMSAAYQVSSATALQFAVSTGGKKTNDTTFGIGASHSLGGGVSISGGVGSLASGNTYADLGVKFNF